GATTAQALTEMGALRGGPQVSEAAWVWTVVLLYVAAGAVVVVVGLAVRLRNLPAAIAPVVLVGLSALHIHHRGITDLIPIGLILLTGLAAVYLLLLRPRMG